MQTRTATQRWGGLTVLGTILVFLGAGWFVFRELRIDPFAGITVAAWPFFVIVPGVALLITSLVRTPPQGAGFAIAGSIVTTVGAVLFYQQATGHWESWAYAWALVGPGGAGLGMLAYGLIFGLRDLVAAGARLVAIAAAIFVAGYWYFETIFATGRAPLDLGEWWPVVIVGAGLLVLVAGSLSNISRDGAPQNHPGASGEIR